MFKTIFVVVGKDYDGHIRTLKAFNNHEFAIQYKNWIVENKKSNYPMAWIEDIEYQENRN